MHSVEMNWPALILRLKPIVSRIGQPFGLEQMVRIDSR